MKYIKRQSFLMVLLAVFMMTGTLYAATPGYRTLFNAVRNSDIIKITDLLNNGMQVDQTDEVGNTALIIAAKQGDNRMVELLLAYKADYDHQNETGTTPMMIAAKYGNKQIIQTLLNNGADYNIRNNDNLRAVDYAKIYKHQDCVALFNQFDFAG